MPEKFEQSFRLFFETWDYERQYLKMLRVKLVVKAESGYWTKSTILLHNIFFCYYFILLTKG